MQSGLGEEALWVLDPTSPKTEAVVPGGLKLVKIDLATNKAVQTLAFDQTIAPPARRRGPALWWFDI